MQICLYLSADIKCVHANVYNFERTRIMIIQNLWRKLLSCGFPPLKMIMFFCILSDAVCGHCFLSPNFTEESSLLLFIMNVIFIRPIYNCRKIYIHIITCRNNLWFTMAVLDTSFLFFALRSFTKKHSKFIKCFREFEHFVRSWTEWVPNQPP